MIITAHSKPDGIGCTGSGVGGRLTIGAGISIGGILITGVGAGSITTGGVGSTGTATVKLAMVDQAPTFGSMDLTLQK